MFRLLSWIPGCRGPKYTRQYDEKSTSLISDTAPSFARVPPLPPPLAHPIPGSYYRRRSIDEDYPSVFRNHPYDRKYRRYPMHEETYQVIASPPRDLLPQPRVVRRETSRKARHSESTYPTHTNDGHHNHAAMRRRIADETLAAIERGEVQFQGSIFRFRDAVLQSRDNTIFFSPDSILASWSTTVPTTLSEHPARLELCEGSTLHRARALLHDLNSSSADSGGSPTRVGVLSFASATRPGGGFLAGAHAQEESLARSSTLYTSLASTIGAQFHELHKRDRRGGFYTHAMLFSPAVLVLRDDAGGWVRPHQIEVVTCAAVNAGVVNERAGDRASSDVAAQIEGTMRERMARILFLFEQQGIRNIVLGSFGTGVFRNDVSMVADIWYDLLAEEGARFTHSFDRVVFGIIDKRTIERFKAVFQSRFEARTAVGWSSGNPNGAGTPLRVVE
jgi:uncharacterized protein (TIGR02452 family)